MKCDLCKKNKMKEVFYTYSYDMDVCSKCWEILNNTQIPDYIPMEQHKRYLIKKNKC